MDSQTLAELNNIRIRIDELLDKELYPVPALSIFIYNTLINEKARLLAVARAAYIYDYCMDEDTERKERLLLIMRAALADVEDLL